MSQRCWLSLQSTQKASPLKPKRGSFNPQPIKTKLHLLRVDQSAGKLETRHDNQHCELPDCCVGCTVLARVRPAAATRVVKRAHLSLLCSLFCLACWRSWWEAERLEEFSSTYSSSTRCVYFIDRSRGTCRCWYSVAVQAARPWSYLPTHSTGQSEGSISSFFFLFHSPSP